MPKRLVARENAVGGVDYFAESKRFAVIVGNVVNGARRTDIHQVTDGINNESPRDEIDEGVGISWNQRDQSIVN